MALIRCPECGKEISDQAVSCPNCGYPIEKIDDGIIDVTLTSEAVPDIFNKTEIDKPKSKKHYIIAGIVAALIVGVSVAIPVIEYNSKPDLYEMMKDYPLYFNAIENDEQFIEINVTADESIYQQGNYYYRFYYLDGDENKPILVRGVSNSEVFDVEEGDTVFGSVGSNIGFNGEFYPGFDLMGVC